MATVNAARSDVMTCCSFVKGGVGRRLHQVWRRGNRMKPASEG